MHYADVGLRGIGFTGEVVRWSKRPTVRSEDGIEGIHACCNFGECRMELTVTNRGGESDTLDCNKVGSGKCDDEIILSESDDYLNQSKNYLTT